MTIVVQPRSPSTMGRLGGIFPPGSFRRFLVRAAALTVTAAAIAGPVLPGSASAAVAAPSLDTLRASPYLYLANARSVDPQRVIAATGLKWFTLAFIDPVGNTCAPQWADGAGGLDGRAKTTIAAIRAAGGDVMVSFGGGSANKLGFTCTTAGSLAAAYQKVITTYRLQAIDLDFEGTESRSDTVRIRNAQALRILQNGNPGLRIHVTMAASANGFNASGNAMVDAVHAAGVQATWSGMNMYFGGSTRMGADTIRSMNGVAAKLRSTYGYSAVEALHRVGSVNLIGVNAGDGNETTTQADMREIAAFVRAHQVGRFSFWNLGRDIACGGSPGSDQCSGVAQQEFDFTRIVTQALNGSPPPQPPQPPAGAWPTLRQGDSGFRVSVLQDLLRQRGHSITADGAFGPATRSAVIALQASAGLSRDGVAGPNTWAAVVSTVRSGSSGDGVSAAQIALNDNGARLSVDGKFGAATQAAVVTFQRGHGLSPDGVVGPKTWMALV